MSISQQVLALLSAAAMVSAVGCNRASPTLSAAEASAKGDAMLREMSKNIAAVNTFAYTADEHREQVGPDGLKSEKKSTRQVIVRRPDAVVFRGKGAGGDIDGWYDGKTLTLVSNRDRVWARGPMPPTLDEAIDYLSAEYGIQIPTGDLLYSSPYDALMTKDTKGGWVGTQRIGTVTCDHLSYQQPVVDWEIWLGPERRLPCRIKLTYKNEPGRPSTTVTFHDPETPQITADTFTAKVPDGFQRIKVMRHATVLIPEEQGGKAPTATATTGTADQQPK